ncbi:hypothetical protein HF086_006844 [Spodoptera exigua]|uniref:Uncharacterized protein n=1 Tax=Spodoptera exigua TaxID=7107 RepID=A0A922SCR5_SPOEX|nr:hypothetical protein HF086_006844 [Spodoptera exigua]
MPVLVTCYRCKKSVDEKKTALCSICKNRMEPDCDGYPLQTYRLKSQESKTKWRCSKCTKKTVPKNVPSPDDNISNNVTVRKKPAYSINHLHTDIYKNKRKLLSPNQDSHILSDYDTSCETDTNTPKRLLTDSLDGSSTIKSPILYYEMQDTIAQLTTKLECAENALECETLQNNELNKQVEELTKEIKLLKSICNSSTIIESSPIVLEQSLKNKQEQQQLTIKTKKPIQASLYDATCKNTIRVFGAQQCVGLAAALTRSRETTRYVKYDVRGETMPNALSDTIVKKCFSTKLCNDDKIIICLAVNIIICQNFAKQLITPYIDCTDYESKYLNPREIRKRLTGINPSTITNNNLNTYKKGTIPYYYKRQENQYLLKKVISNTKSTETSKRGTILHYFPIVNKKNETTFFRA